MSVTIADVEEIFSYTRLMQPPKHVFIFMTSQLDIDEEKGSLFRGLQPTDRNDIVILTPMASRETILHEASHASFGTEEFFTYPFGKVMTFIDKKRTHRRKRRKLEYDLCNGCPMCKDPNNIGITGWDGGGLPLHFILLYSHKTRRIPPLKLRK